MTKWVKVHGSQTEKPTEFETETSSVFVYQRRNIERVNDLWEYEERKMNRDEYREILKENEITQLQLAVCELFEILG